MSRQEQLNLYIGQLRRRLRALATVRGAAVIAAVALVTTIGLTLLLNAYAFPEHGLTPARLVLLAVVVAAIAFGLALPWLRLSRDKSIHQAESQFPELEQRLLTFSERQQAGDPFIELLAGDTLTITEDAPPSRMVPQGRLFAFLAGAVVVSAVLVWMIVAAPGYMGYGASLLWTGPKKDATPLYSIRVTPGDAAVRRNSDELVTAQVIGLEPSKVTLYARFANASTWEPVDMQPQQGGQGFQFMFTGLPQSVEYYVAAGPVRSKHFNFRVVDLPGVKAMQVTYRYPKWTGMQTVSDEHGGDLRALEGTDADLTITMDSPLKDGLLALDGGEQLHLTSVGGTTYRATIHMAKDGAYHVAATDAGQQVRLSEDYFISTTKANPPDIAISRPGADYRASPIEEVTVGVKAGADFGLQHVSLHYSVNGGAEQTVDLLKQLGAKDSNGTATLNLEDFKLVPGDVISLYATARDAHAESKTDISFIQVDPFEREFSQSQQSGGGGGGGGQQAGDQTDISRREKELIAATWKQQNDKTSNAQKAADTGKVLSEAQATLREQVLALSARMQSRDLSSANEEFNGFEKDMQAAAAAMIPSADKLKKLAWSDAMPNEQKALQALLRAEATFRQIQVAFGQQGGGGGGGSAGRDLASLFDLEMDTEKNQYETAQTGSPAEQQAKKIDDALQKLDALAKRQEELAQQQGNQAQTFQQRWQQEMLRRQAEELQREMEQMQNQQGQGQQASSSGSSQSSSQSSGSQGKQSQQQAKGQSGSGSGGGQESASSKDGNTDPRVQQALDRLREANQEMSRAGSQPQAGKSQGTPGRQGAPGQQGADQARRAAERLREATDLLAGAQKQQTSGKLDSLARDAGRISKEESAQAERIRSLAAHIHDPAPAQREANEHELDKLVEDRQHLSDDFSHLEKGLRDTARQLAPTQPAASSKLRDALGEINEADLGNRIQRTADGLRRGIDPNGNGNEAAIASELKKLNDGVRGAQQGIGQGTDAQDKRGRGQGTETAALDHVDRLRSAIQSLSDGRGQRGQGNQPGNQAGQRGHAGRQGQPGQQPSQGGRQGGNGQQAGGQQQGGQQPGSQQAGGGQGGGQQPGGRQTGSQQAGIANGQRNGDVGGNRNNRGGGEGVAIYNVDTGNSGFDPKAKHVQAPAKTASLPDSEGTINQGMKELNQLRQLAHNDPAASRDIDDLVKEMQHLDPSRFPGNPAMVEQLHTQVLNDIDKLELQLRRSSGDPASAQVRAGKAPTVPAGYQDAVADYFRRLGKAQ